MSVFLFDDCQISIDMQRNLSGATNPVIIFKKPDNSVGSWDANISGTVLTYSANNGEFDQLGRWQLEGRITQGGQKISSDIISIMVEKPLDA